jgi:riboflavin kinase/FMN adenylyltransferase
MTALRREACLLAAGADAVCAMSVDAALLSLSPQAFIEQWVVPRRPSVLVEGEDFRFGRHRAGDIALLQRMGEVHGWRVQVVPSQVSTLADGVEVEVRSELIRWLLRAGRVAEAAVLLGRPYKLEGRVVSGARRGRTLGVPTANLDVGDGVVPMHGVYAAVGRRPDGLVYPAAVSIGTNATFGEGETTIEAHLLDFDGPLDDYGWTLELDMVSWLRDQVKCGDVASLMTLIERDVACTRAAVAQGDYAFAP